MFKNVTIYSESDWINYDWNKPDKKLFPQDSVGRVVGAQPVDQIDSMPFMMGENGFRRSDISLIINAQSDDLKQSIASRLVELRSDFPDQTLPDEQLAALTIPRRCQSAAEFRDWAAARDNSQFAKAVDDYISKHQPKTEQTIKFDDNPSSSE